MQTIMRKESIAKVCQTFYLISARLLAYWLTVNKLLEAIFFPSALVELERIKYISHKQKQQDAEDRRNNLGELL